MANYQLAMFEKYIHTNECSDEGGWFAFFTPEEDSLSRCEMMQPGMYVNGRETEEEAVQELVRMACQAIRDTQRQHGYSGDAVDFIQEGTEETIR